MRKLTLKDQALFNKYLPLSNPELAVFSFANIYIWRSLYDIRWEIIENCLCVFFKDNIGSFMYLPPLGKERRPQVLKEVFSIMDKSNSNPDISRIENIQEEDVGYFRALGYLCHEKYPDYLCLREELAGLKGNKFKSQRCSYNYFIKHYSYSWRSLRQSDTPGLLSLFNRWIDQRKAFYNDDVYCGMLEDNRRMIKDISGDYKKLKFEGIVVLVDKKIKGFTFGYKLNRQTFCILYEVTDLSVKGLAQFIFRQFSQNLSGYKYINIMDDSGLDNLRKTKLSYKPVRQIAAYIATRDA
ncbi:MAG: phosphatidylglycerol lysyltransferase domain-containing protein [Candidatus Omnitrophica bacterium]|nr:phosphatidylglycerol lysyltransferase domain-containing protein [Candidatus Omnitrophota bacterium]